MFGIIVSGRMVSTNFEAVAENHFITEIPNADDINHITIFMTGQNFFPDGFGALIYLSWPSTGSSPDWQLLGYIGNDKPSSVFKVSGLKKKSGPIRYVPQQAPTPHDQPGFIQFVPEQPITSNQSARIGISVESIDFVQQQIATLENSKPNASHVAEFSQKMLESFVNFAGSFAVQQSQMEPNPTENFVSFSVVQTWYENFMRKLENNPNFWKS